MVSQIYKKYFENKIGWNEFNFNINISLKDKFVYIETPKAACSTIKRRLTSYVCRNISYKSKIVHPNIVESPFVKPYQVSNESLYDILFGSEYYRFAFVRNPYERVLSAYLDKIVRNKPQKENLLKKFRLYNQNESDMSFEEFLSLVEKQTDKEMDKHWRPQASLIFTDIIDYQIIGRFENFDSDWQKIKSDIFLEDYVTDNTEESIIWHSTDSSNKIDEYYNDFTIEKVGKIYNEDFEKFSYCKKHPG